MLVNNEVIDQYNADNSEFTDVVEPAISEFEPQISASNGYAPVELGLEVPATIPPINTEEDPMIEKDPEVEDILKKLEATLARSNANLVEANEVFTELPNITGSVKPERFDNVAIEVPKKITDQSKPLKISEAEQRANEALADLRKTVEDLFMRYEENTAARVASEENLKRYERENRLLKYENQQLLYKIERHRTSEKEALGIAAEALKNYATPESVQTPREPIQFDASFSAMAEASGGANGESRKRSNIPKPAGSAAGQTIKETTIDYRIAA